LSEKLLRRPADGVVLFAAGVVHDVAELQRMPALLHVLFAGRERGFHRRVGGPGGDVLHVVDHQPLLVGLGQSASVGTFRGSGGRTMAEERQSKEQYCRQQRTT